MYHYQHNVMGERLTVARWPPCADVVDSAVRHLVFIYIYGRHGLCLQSQDGKGMCRCEFWGCSNLVEMLYIQNDCNASYSSECILLFVFVCLGAEPSSIKRLEIKFQSEPLSKHLQPFPLHPSGEFLAGPLLIRGLMVTGRA